MSLNFETTVSAFAMYKTGAKKKSKSKVNVEPAKKKKLNSFEVSIASNEDTSIGTPQNNGITKLKKKPKKNLKKEKKANFVKKESDEEEPPLLVPITGKKSLEKGNLKKIQEDEHVVSSNSLHFNEVDSSTEGLKVFRWLINPITPDEFFKLYWEQRVLHIERNNQNYYKQILTTEKLDTMFREFPLYYTRNVDVVSYENGVKEVHNSEGRVAAAAVYDYYSNGCSVRVLNPQTYDQKVHLLIASLQEYFGTMVGTNVYLTPPGSQGFAPHYDDIEAFILQLEGRKYWKLYKPAGSDILARDSSPNLQHENIGEPFMEVTLNAGDLLYFPRGTIHEGRTDPEAHSLHITVSVYQHTAYADLLEHVLPQALKRAAQENVEFRQGLPINYLKHLGYVNGTSKSKERSVIVDRLKRLINLLPLYADFDNAADRLGKKFMYDSMPPVLSKNEVEHTSRYDGDFMRNGEVFNRAEIGLDTEVRLLRYYCLRLVVEEDSAKIYYNVDNAKVYHGEEEQFLEIGTDLIPCIEKLQNVYPEFVSVEELPIDDDIGKAQLVSDLWERGLLVTNGPLPVLSGESGEESD